ncbi:MAG: carboxypeptidase M32 [candidate division WOR-3 bacterium]
MQEKLAQLKTILAEIADLRYVSQLLGWDQQTYMPPGGAEGRSHQIALIERLAHERSTSAELGRLLEELKPYADSLDPDSDEARLIKVTARLYDKETRIPSRHVVEFTEATTLGYHAWVKARAESDFSLFRPHLERIVDLRKEYASFFPDCDHPYDALLDYFEPNMKTAEVKAIFDDLRPKQVELIQAIAARPQVDDSFLHQPFDEQKQWAFGEPVITRFGYDWNCGRQDRAPHPFTTSFSFKDVRITTRVDPEFLNSMLFGTMHECGHALYDAGVNPAYERTSLGTAASYAVHESQSRMWENLVGRSLPFWEYFYPALQETFPQLSDIPLEKFYKGINKVQPSLIRVEADEATYNLHIMLRFEIELALLENRVTVGDLPDLWNTKMQEYLGITPPDDARGVLQDVHWSSGYLGYFPTYALGNLISAQMWETIHQEIPDLPDQIRAGKFDSLLRWLREKVHRWGAKYDPQELVQRVTGAPIGATAYLRYLTRKFGEIYGL